MLVKKIHHNAKKVKDEKTGKVYSSVKEAAKKIGCSKSHLASQLNGTLENRTTFKYEQ